MDIVTDRRTELAAGLRALADWLDVHDGLALREHERLTLGRSVLHDVDVAGITEVQEWADALGVDMIVRSGGRQYVAERDFGLVHVEVGYCSVSEMAEHTARRTVAQAARWAVACGHDQVLLGDRYGTEDEARTAMAVHGEQCDRGHTIKLVSGNVAVSL